MPTNSLAKQRANQPNQCANLRPNNWPNNWSNKRRQRGQALLILLTVLSLAGTSLYLGALNRARLDTAATQRTLGALARARAALLGFAVTHGRLPRPATSATDGTESPLPCVTEAACTGFQPWATLSVPRTDAWGKLLRYSVTPVFTATPLQRVSAVGTKTILTRTGAGTITYLAGNPDCSLGSQCPAVVVYSNGEHNFGVDRLGLAQANGARGNVDEAANQVAVQHFMRRAASANPGVPGGPFDDLVVWIAPADLYPPMARAHVLP
jgi:hypothetical protein